MDRSELHMALLAAHGAQDEAALAELYARAADLAEEDDEEDAACFFLTQAYVFALSAGLPQAAGLNRRLAEQGRDDLQLDLA